MTTKIFFLIWSSSTKYCQHRHETYELAVKEIKRLQKKEPTRKFYILKAIATIRRKRKPTRKQLEKLVELIKNN